MITKLYKYRSFNDEFLNSIITNSSLYYSPIKYFNDPFDYTLEFKKEYSEEERQIYLTKALSRNGQSIDTVNIEGLIKLFEEKTKELINSIGVLSLSANYESILIWSHYADSHNGLVFEFEPLHYQGYNCLYQPKKVDYDEKYELLSYLESDDGSELTNLMLLMKNVFYLII